MNTKINIDGVGDPASVPEYFELDRRRFDEEIVAGGRPAVLRGLVAGWPAVTAARHSPSDFIDYLRRETTDAAGEIWAARPEVAGRFDFSADLDGYNFERKLATVAELLDLVDRLRDDPEPWAVYGGALRLRDHWPAFEDSHPMPLLDPDRDRLVSLWLGNRTSTAAHWDLPQNLACVVAGRRRFTLFPTDQVANLYVGPIDKTLAGQPSSLVDVEAPDFDRFPRFRTALAHAQVAVLEPGDALYIPSLWWHAVRGLDPVGAMVNYWWRDGAAALATPMLALLHAVMLMKDLPAREREAWRIMFDHYVFHADGDPAAHLPVTARGIMGTPSAERLETVRARLARSLLP